MLGYLSSIYKARMYETYIVNCPVSIEIIYNLNKNKLDEVSRSKIKVCNKSSPDSLYKHCSKC